MSDVYGGVEVPVVSDSGTLASDNVARPSDLFQAPRLRELRRAAVLSQDELAKRAGVGRSAVIKLENEGYARAGTIRKLAKALGVEPAELMREPPGE